MTKPKSAQKKTRTPSVRSLRVPGEQQTEQRQQSNPAPSSLDKRKQNRFFTNLLRVLALFAVIGITLFVFSIRDRVEQFAVLGYPGIFLIALLANATVLLPAPGVAVIYAMGAIFNPFGVGLAAGTGGALGSAVRLLWSAQISITACDPGWRNMEAGRFWFYLQSLTLSLISLELRQASQKCPFALFFCLHGSAN